MSETLEYEPSEREMALSAAQRHRAFHQKIAERAAAVVPPKPVIVAPAPEPVPPRMVERYSFKETWFSIEDVTVPRSLSLRQIKEMVCERYGTKMTDLVSARRTCTIVEPRMVAMYLCKELTGKSLPEIGRNFGGRDHTTVLNAVRKIPARMLTNARLADDVDAIRSALETLL